MFLQPLRTLISVSALRHDRAVVRRHDEIATQHSPVDPDVTTSTGSGWRCCSYVHVSPYQLTGAQGSNAARDFAGFFAERAGDGFGKDASATGISDAYKRLRSVGLKSVRLIFARELTSLHKMVESGEVARIDNLKHRSERDLGSPQPRGSLQIGSTSTSTYSTASSKPPRP